MIYTKLIQRCMGKGLLNTFLLNISGVSYVSYIALLYTMADSSNC